MQLKNAILKGFYLEVVERYVERSYFANFTWNRHASQAKSL